MTAVLFETVTRTYYTCSQLADGGPATDTDTRQLTGWELAEFVRMGQRDAAEWGVCGTVHVNGVLYAAFGDVSGTDASMERQHALAGLPCSSEWGPAHTWLVLVSTHSATAPYGCQHCPARHEGTPATSAEQLARLSQ
jgi:hypothetical protein